MHSPGKFLEEQNDGIASARGARNKDYKTLDHTPLSSYQPNPARSSPLRKAAPEADYFPYQPTISHLHAPTAYSTGSKPSATTYIDSGRSKQIELPFQVIDNPVFSIQKSAYESQIEDSQLKEQSVQIHSESPTKNK